MTDDRDRRHDLIAAAASGDLTESERQELALLAAADPTVWQEVDELRGVVEQLRGLDHWDPSLPRPDLADRIAERVRSGDEAAAPGRWRRSALLATAAAVLLLAGAAGGLAVQDIREAPPIGPPGTLGAVEVVDFDRAPAGVDLTASVVAHTWGTEAIIDVSGLAPGETYEIVFVDETGADVSAGAFLGSDVVIHCRMNAAVLRDDVIALRIELDDGTVVGAARLPEVAG
ncbi:anti-sigma factor domain-containing protein [Aeromicrobium marinum]|uniref:anti-sigma factor domain-containing protein n=1 Tax=Aeromicrobium marinum TaxID=219314 RepID=UPI00067FEA9C|nr:anti-sigma factor [Aeromicrobium marinum]